MKRRLVPDVVRLTASSYANYLRCPRLFYNKTLLQLPASDSGASADQGLFVHEVLQEIHVTGSCHDVEHVRALLGRMNADTPAMAAFVEDHRRKCPRSFEHQEHEADRVRFHRSPPPMFMASVRIDAEWVHDGVLDVRDYKTARKWHDDLAEDPSARIQAWVMAKQASSRGLRLRLRYEYLSPDVDDDPDPWEPDEDDLAAIEEELRRTAERITTEQSWRGISERDVCRTCVYRSICRDSAAPGEPNWPVLAHE